MNASADRDVLIALSTRDLESEHDALATGEVWSLLRALREQGLRPSDLVHGKVSSALGADNGEQLTGRLKLVERVGGLVERYASQGLWLITALDEEYPQRLLDRLRDRAPVLFYGAGAPSLLAFDGIAVVGSRDVDDAAVSTAQAMASAITGSGVPLISGGARGIDQIAMDTAAARGGSVVGVLTHPLEREARRAGVQQLIAEERLCLITPFRPSAGFTVANAMARNKVIYGLARCTVVVASDAGKGGTWSGAVEALRRGYGPVAVWTGAGGGPGNAKLIELGAIPVAGPEALVEISHDDFAPTTESIEQLSLDM